MKEPTPSTVFLSYAQGDRGYQDRMLAFADRLTELGLDVLFDQYEPNPDKGWTKWMEDGVRRSDFILVFCTPAYYERAIEEQVPGTGLGAQTEVSMIYSLVSSEPDQRKKVQTVQFDKPNVQTIPLLIRPSNRFTPKKAELEDDEFERLYRLLTKQTLERPKKGKLQKLDDRRGSRPTKADRLPARPRTSAPRSGIPAVAFGKPSPQVDCDVEKEPTKRGARSKKTVQDRKQASQKLNLAREACRDKMFDKSARLCKEAKLLGARPRTANRILTEVYLRSHRWPQAKALFEERIKHGERLTLVDDIRMHIARYHSEDDEIERESIERIAQEHAADHEVQAELGKFLDRIGDRAAAVECFEASLSRKRTPLILMELAVVRWRDGDFAEATELLEEASKKDKRDPLIWANLGVGRAEMNLFGLAIEALRQSLAVRPDYQFSRYALAEIYAMMGDAEAAIEPLRELVANKYYGLPRLLTERTFDPIRKTPKFKKFLASVPAKLLSASSV